ncbi:MAG: anhydro-N-acetylmuramic acid kinase [Saprospiraceae bacterium]|nr:anhydro-N-acetylmuramic acid kinase [Saprospiraceae bacterium]
MLRHIHQLAALAQKPQRTILGLMSGTSLDGLDLALCAVEGAGPGTRVRVLQFDTAPFEAAFQAEIRRVFAQRQVDFQHLVLLNVVVAEKHAALIHEALQRWGVSAADIDLIASHGQTVFHAPRHIHGLPDYPHATLQIGDGDHLAYRTGIITVSDFRQKHLAAGGEGAPLALYGDYLLFSEPGEDRFLLNIGGIANFTFLPGDGDASKAFATDTGPGNTLLDAAARQFFGQPYDADARFALQGRVLESALERLLQYPYFQRPFPCTTGPEEFSLEWVARTAGLSEWPDACDLMATLTHLTARTIAQGIRRVPRTCPRATVYLSGGGAHNPLVRQLLRQWLPDDIAIAPMEALGISADAKEAVLFAVLANETVAGTAPSDAQLGGIPWVGMGKISFPR